MIFLIFFTLLFANFNLVSCAPNPKFRHCIQTVLRDASNIRPNPIFEALADDDIFKDNPNGFLDVAVQYECLNAQLKETLPRRSPPRGLFLGNGEESRISKANVAVESVLFDGDMVLTPHQFTELIEEERNDPFLQDEPSDGGEGEGDKEEIETTENNGKKEQDKQNYSTIPATEAATILAASNGTDANNTTETAIAAANTTASVSLNDNNMKKEDSKETEGIKGNQTQTELEQKKKTRRKRKVDGDRKLRWSFPIRYSFTKKMSNSGKRAVQQAIKFWQSNTCLRFKEDDKSRGDKISFTKSDGCWSYIGRQRGSQTLSIGTGCEYMDIAAHEIGHAMGFYHEQSRSDRDKYISIARNNIEPNNVYNFERMKNMKDYKGCYDYGSVMHYQANAFGKDSNRPTMLAANPLYQDTMGSWFISFTDIMQMNRAYNCLEECKNSPKLACKNGGYQDPNSCAKCKCPYGFGGTLCDGLMKSNPADCGGKVLSASGAWKKLNLATRKSGDCYFHINSPKGTTIEIRFSSLAASCEPGCSVDFVEIKTGIDSCGYNKPGPDYQATGYRFCCLATKDTMVTASNLGVIIVHTGKHVRMELQYKIKSSGSSAEEGEEIIVKPSIIDEWGKEEDLSPKLVSSEGSLEDKTEEGEGGSEEKISGCLASYGPWAEWTECCGGCPQIRIRACLTQESCPCPQSQLLEDRDCCTESLCPKCNNGGPVCCDNYSHIWDRCLKQSQTGATTTRKSRGSSSRFAGLSGCRK